MRSLKEKLFNFGNSETSSEIAFFLGALMGLIAGLTTPILWLRIPLIILFIICLLYLGARVLSLGFGAEKFRGETWHSYHKSYREGAETWVYGTFEFERRSSKSKLVGCHRDVEPRNHEYDFEGYIDRGGNLLFFERNRTNRNDNCLGYFNNAHLGDDVYLGYWIGPSERLKPVIGPYILSREPLAKNGEQLKKEDRDKRCEEMMRLNPLYNLVPPHESE